MSEKLTKGCVVFMKATSGLVGHGNAQCISDVCEPLGTVSLYGHNQNYKTYDIDRIVEYPFATLQAENKQQSDFMALAKEEMDSLQAENKRLREALEVAVKLIELWHCMGMSKEQAKLSWEIYKEKSPEMQQLEQALEK